MRRHWPHPESITVHPADRAWLARQLPDATIYGEPVPQDTPVLEDSGVMPGTVRIRTDGRDVTVSLGKPLVPGPYWTLPEPYPNALGIEATGV